MFDRDMYGVTDTDPRLSDEVPYLSGYNRTPEKPAKRKHVASREKVPTKSEVQAANRAAAA